MATKDEVYGSGEFIKADTLKQQPNGEMGPLTIAGSEVASFDDGKSQVVLAFTETDMKLGLNATNFSVIANELDKPDSDDWAGAHLTVWRDPSVTYMGKVVGGVKVKNVGWPANKPAPVTTPSGEKFGAAWEAKLQERLKAIDSDETRLRATLVNDFNVPHDTVSNSIADWPKEIQHHIKDALAKMESGEDIPF